mgnify:CR=1 FL=1
MKVIALHQEERDIISQAAENNRHAQQKIYSKYSPKMLSICRQYIKDLHQAEDIMITAFMKVFTNLKNFEHKGSFEGWIRRIMVNECISYLRVQKKVGFLEDEFYVEDCSIATKAEFCLSSDNISNWDACEEGMEGALCGMCIRSESFSSPLYHRGVDGKCAQCEDNGANLVYFLIFVVGFSALVENPSIHFAFRLKSHVEKHERFDP